MRVERVYHRRHRGERDAYGYAIGRRRRRVDACRCRVPCKAWRCKGCDKRSSWCEGGADCASDEHDDETCPHEPSCSDVCADCYVARLNVAPTMAAPDAESSPTGSAS